MRQLHVIQEDYDNYKRRKQKEYIARLKWIPPVFLCTFGLMALSIPTKFTGGMGLLLLSTSFLWGYCSIKQSKKTGEWFSK